MKRSLTRFAFEFPKLSASKFLSRFVVLHDAAADLLLPIAVAATLLRLPTVVATTVALLTAAVRVWFSACVVAWPTCDAVCVE